MSYLAIITLREVINIINTEALIFNMLSHNFLMFLEKKQINCKNAAALDYSTIFTSPLANNKLFLNDYYYCELVKTKLPF